LDQAGATFQGLLDQAAPQVHLVEISAPGFRQDFTTGWWCNNHLEKYESQLGRTIPYIMENKSHVPNHQPEDVGFHDRSDEPSASIDVTKKCEVN